VLDRLGRIPDVGEGFGHDEWRLEVAARDRLRVAAVRLSNRPRRDGDEGSA
jgi:CBS domain containing-hemolysin-like protein